MAKDESPADVPAPRADVPADAVPQDEAPAAPSRASSRRRSPSGRTARSRRAPLPQETPALPELEPPTPAAEPSSPAKPARSTRRRTARTTAAAEPSAAAEVPPAAEIADTGTIPEAPAPPARRRTTRRKGGEAPAAPPALPVEPVAPPVSAEAAPAVEEAAPAAKPSRRRGGRRRAEPEAPTHVETPPVAEAPPPPAAEEAAPTRTARRRGGRRRATTEEKQTSAAVPVEEPAAAAAPAETEAPPKPSRRRGGRRRAEPEAPPVPEAREPAPAAEPVAEPVREEVRPQRGRGARRAAPPPEELKVGGRLVTRRGLVELHIHGEPTVPTLFFGNVEGQTEASRVASEVKRAAAYGIHVHSTLVEIPCPLSPDDTVYETIDSRVEVFLDADPRAYVIPRLVFLPAPGWMRQYPHEVTHYADQKSADPSIASDRFWMDAEHALAAVIEHVQRTTYGERVIGYHLERGEWFNPVDNGFDRSLANREAFREWLRAKYKNSVVALRAAWYDGEVQFHTAEIPPMPAAPRPELTFFEPRKERRWIDFLEYTSDVTADRLIALSKVVKRASNDRALVSVCYGYTFEFTHTFSGHLALARVLAAPTIDIVAGPPSYRDRQPGEAGSLPAPVDSMMLHGKLWVSEDDTKTYLAPPEPSPDDFNPRLDGRYATDMVHARAAGKALAHQTGVAWMDLWGEGWLDSEDVWRPIGTFSERYSRFLKVRKAEAPEVAVLIGERALAHVQKGPAFLERLLREQREAIQRSGASVGFYLQSDVTSRSFPTDARLYVFLTPYRLPADQRAAIKEKLQKGDRTLVFLYAVGVCDEKGQPEEAAHDVIGITLRPQPWNSEVGSRITDSHHAITEKVQQREFGVRERLNPSYYVDDDEPGLTILAEYVKSGLPSMAVRQHAGWRSVFCGEPTLNTDIFRGLCKFAGAHLYTQYGEDYVSAGYGWLTTHTPREGNRTLLLPPGTALYDLQEGRVVAEDTPEYKAFVKSRTTRSFFVGTLEEMRKLDLPGTERARGRRSSARRVREPEPEPVAAEPQGPRPDPAGAILPLPEPDLDLDGAKLEVVDVEIEGEVVAETASEDGAEGGAHHRRRRRRGGRGRGRRRREGEVAAGEPGAADVGAPAE